MASISSAVAVQVKGRGLVFQEAMKARMVFTRICTEAKVPRRMAWRVMMPLGALRCNPQPLHLCEAGAPATGAEVSGERSGGLCSEADSALFVALAGQDDGVGVQVDVGHEQITDLGEACAGVVEHPHQGMVTQLDEAVALAGAEDLLGLGVAEYLDQLLCRSRLREVVHRRSLDLVLLGQPAEELLEGLMFVQTRCCRAGLDHPGLERDDLSPFHQGRVDGAGGLRRLVVEVGGQLAGR